MPWACLQAHQAPLIFWDLGGQAGLRSIWDKYYAESHALIFVVDSSENPELCRAPAAERPVMCQVCHRDCCLKAIAECGPTQVQSSNAAAVSPISSRFLA